MIERSTASNMHGNSSATAREASVDASSTTITSCATSPFANIDERQACSVRSALWTGMTTLTSGFIAINRAMLVFSG